MEPDGSILQEIQLYSYCLCELRSEEVFESVEKIFAAGFDSDNSASVAFDRSFHSFLINACFQNKFTRFGCLKKSQWLLCSKRFNRIYELLVLHNA